MSPSFIIGLSAGIILLHFFLELWLEHLNTKAILQPIPDVLRDIYTEEQHQKAIRYKIKNSRFQLARSIFDLLLIIVFIGCGGLAFLNDFVLSISSSTINQSLLFFAFLFFGYDFLHIPFSAYHTFIIENQFGFNKTTFKTFFLDYIKSWLLIFIIGGSLLYVILWFYFKFPSSFWIYAWIITSVFSILIAMFYTSLIVPLFNKLSPLPSGELKNTIESFAQKAGFVLSGIFTIDQSKRSTKANAYFSGLGKQKRIILFDTLLQQLSTNEIVAVLAHEIGHYKKKHILVGLLFGFIQTGFLFFIFSLIAHSVLLTESLLNPPFGYQAQMNPHIAFFHLNIIVFTLLFSPISLIFNTIRNHISRQNEYEADAFAAQYNLVQPLISGLKTLSKTNLSHPSPHPYYVAIYYSHPPLVKRIEALKQFNK